MKFPRLKNALFCRIFIYVVLIGVFFTPMIVVVNLNFIPDGVKIIICLSLIIGLIVYIIKNDEVLEDMDWTLADIDCQLKARKYFKLPYSFSVQKVEKKISRFGKKYEPIAYSPRPEKLQYKSSPSFTIFSCGIEKIIATYHVDFLDKNQYHSILNSAKANSKALKGKKKHYFLDKSQKESPLNRVTVVVIYAKQVDEKLRNGLYDIVCKNGGDGVETAILPCVVDLEKQICTFSSMRISFYCPPYPVKNRGIRIIRKYLFNNRFTFADSPDMIYLYEFIDPEQSLWSFWRTTKKENLLMDKELDKYFEQMKDRDIIFEDGYIYLKWKENGIWVAVELNDELRTAEIDAIELWYYPKPNKIAKDTVKEIKNLLNTYFAGLGYTAKYISYE